jgi:tRNA(Ile)-lysidine synthase
VLSPSPPALPLGLAEFAARLDRLASFETAPFVAVAVSGGPDSLALAILADKWARQRGGGIRALCVDHRLRPESEAETSRVAGWLAARSICHQILVWEGEKPQTGIQEAARAARYRLLGEWCRAQGCLHLLTAHHRDDQVETHLLRRDARSGSDGLAGMPAIRELDGCRILRPLLDISKTRLLATLGAESQPFIADPSNRNPAFARTRLREHAAEADRDRIADDIRGRGRERALRERDRDALLARAVSVHPAGFAVLDPAVLLSAPPDIAERALSILVFALGGGSYPPRRPAVARMLRVLGGAARGGYALGGGWFVAWRERVLVLRELAAAAGPVRVGPGAAVLWDRRFAVASGSGAGVLTLGYLGHDGVVELHRQWATARHHPLPALIHPILPAFRDEKGLAAVPALGYRRNGGILLPSLFFSPVNSLSHASFAVV